MCQKQGIERKYDERYPYLFFHNFVRRAPKYRYKLQSKEKKIHYRGGNTDSCKIQCIGKATDNDAVDGVVKLLKYIAANQRQH